VRCDCLVVGTWQQGLIIQQGEALRALGKSDSAHDLYPLHAELNAGEPLRVVSHRIPMRGRTLRGLLQGLDSGRVHFLSGELRLGAQRPEPVEGLDRYQPVRWSGKVLRLHTARAQDLGPYLDLVAADGELYLQIWLQDGDPAVELRFGGDEAGESLIPEGLKGYL
jgi:inner membrane protein